MAKDTRSRAAGRRGGGTLLIIGGREDKAGDALIHRELVRHVGSGALVVATVASGVPGELWADYEPLFHRLGVDDVRHLDLSARAQACADETLALLDGATGVFFTGGDQLRITGLLGGTPTAARIQAIYDEGGVVAGTSAGASVMSTTMMVAGAGSETYRIGQGLRMAPGLGLLHDVIVDQHFAERGRIGRLLGAVAQNPALLGVGIDEDTAMVVERSAERHCFRVVGAGAVYVADAHGASYTNVSEEQRDRALSLFGVRLHVLSQGDEFDLATRQPTNHPAESVEESLGVAR